MAASGLDTSSNLRTAKLNNVDTISQELGGTSRLPHSKPIQPSPASGLLNNAKSPLPTSDDEFEVWDPYKSDSPTPEPERSGPADPKEIEHAAATIKLLYEHDRKLFKAVNKLKERTAAIRAKTISLRKTMMVQKGLRQRLEHYIKHWKPIDPVWSSTEWYGDMPFRARAEGDWIRVLDDDEESAEEEPLPQNAMPTLVRDASGAFPSVEAHLARHAHLLSDQSDSLPDSTRPPASDTLPRNVNEGHVVEEESKNFEPSVYATTSRTEFNGNGKRLRSSVSDDENPDPRVTRDDVVRSPPLKRQNTGLGQSSTSSSLAKVIAREQLSPSSSQSESLQDRLDRQSIMQMLDPDADDLEYDGGRPLASTPASPPSGPRIPASLDARPLSIPPIEETPGMEGEAADILAPLPRNSRSTPGQSKGGEEGEEIHALPPAKRSRRRPVQPAQNPSTRRSTRSMSRGLK